MRLTWQVENALGVHMHNVTRNIAKFKVDAATGRALLLVAHSSDPRYEEAEGDFSHRRDDSEGLIKQLTTATFAGYVRAHRLAQRAAARHAQRARRAVHRHLDVEREGRLEVRRSLEVREQLLGRVEGRGGGGGGGGRGHAQRDEQQKGGAKHSCHFESVLSLSLSSAVANPNPFSSSASKSKVQSQTAVLSRAVEGLRLSSIVKQSWALASRYS